MLTMYDYVPNGYLYLNYFNLCHSRILIILFGSALKTLQHNLIGTMEMSH
jgi:hypothetical protein